MKKIKALIILGTPLVLVALLISLIFMFLNRDKSQEALYLGTKDYGNVQVSKTNIDKLEYQFEIEGEVTNLKISKENRTEFLNTLKKGYQYKVETEEDELISVLPVEREETSSKPAVSGTPGEKSLLNFLKTATMPVGHSLYMFGGGWDYEDNGGSYISRTIGIAPEWEDFFKQQDATYDYEDQEMHYFPTTELNEYYFAGFDCSGYVGWSLYNTLESESLVEGADYVKDAVTLAKYLAYDEGLGTYSRKTTVKPGDIISLSNHTWISYGTMPDGSILISHSTPSASYEGAEGGGPQFSALAYSEGSQAYQLAVRIMNTFYPEWAERYPVQTFPTSYYFIYDEEDCGVFTWDTTAKGGISDAEGIQNMTADKVVEKIFGKL